MEYSKELPIKLYLSKIQIQVTEEEYRRLKEIKSRFFPMSVLTLNWGKKWYVIQYYPGKEAWELNLRDTHRILWNLKDFCLETGINYDEALQYGKFTEKKELEEESDSPLPSVPQNVLNEKEQELPTPFPLNILDYVCLLTDEEQWNQLQNFMKEVHTINGVPVIKASCFYVFSPQRKWTCFCPELSNHHLLRQKQRLSFWIYNSNSTKGRTVVNYFQYMELLRMCKIEFRGVSQASTHYSDVVNSVFEQIMNTGLEIHVPKRIILMAGEHCTVKEPVRFVPPDEDDSPIFNSPNPKLIKSTVVFHPDAYEDNLPF